jgi:hypothetical protein
MAKNQTIRVQPDVLEADQKAFLLLKDMSDYKPTNPACSIAAMSAKYEALRAAQEKELKLQDALTAARDATVAAGWDLHNGMLDVKVQVAAQYGTSSDQVASLGLKKKSERKAPGRAPKLDKTVQKTS